MKILNTICLLIVTILFASCDGMLDNIQGYLDEGETVYVGKLVSPYANPGKNRIQLNGTLYYGVTQKQCLIEWKAPDGTNGSKEVSVQREEQLDIFSIILDNLQEGQYDFTFTTMDATGNRSLPTTTQGYVYGDFYEQSLMNRNIAQIEAYKQEGFMITWRPLNEEGAIKTEVTYITDEGPQTVSVPINENSTLLKGCIPGSTITWKTEYIPVEDAIDIFYSTPSEKEAPNDFVIQLNKNNFKEVILPTDAKMNYWGFSLSNIWNGNTNWEANSMCHSGDAEGWPQWFTFDLGMLTKPDRYRYWQRLQEAYLYEKGDNTRKWELYGRADTPPVDGSWDGWIKLMDCESIKPSGVFDKTLTTEDIEYAKAGELFMFPEDTPPIRYIRWKTSETFSGKHTVHFQQITFWGEDLSE